METDAAAYVFRTRGGTLATLLLYRRLVSQYLVVVYRARRAHVLLASFAELLDVVPIRAARLPAMRLELRKAVGETRDAWLSEALAVLDVQLL